MRLETQRALLDRISQHRSDGRGTDTSANSMRQPTAAYTDTERLARERQLLATQPSIVGLSGLVPEPNSYATVQVGDASVIVTRNRDGQVGAMLNVCRHRGAELTFGCGQAARLSCPYHGWTYHLDGSSAARRRPGYFDDVEVEGLTKLPVLEQHGLIWVSADPDGLIGEDPLSSAADELAPFGLETYRLFESTTFTRPMNWKLAIDTFCEAYHLSSLHRETLAPLIHDDYALFDAAGLHGRMIAVRKSISELDAAEMDDLDSVELGLQDQPLLPHATILWFLVPNTVLIHQQDHVQLYQTRPGATPAEAHLTVTLYVPKESERSDRYWKKNFELLVNVTDTEDFAAAAGIQRGYGTAAQTHVVFGRNEPALQHYHRSINKLLDNR